MIALPTQWQRSSVVEQGTHKPLVASSNLAAATIGILGIPRPQLSPFQRQRLCVSIFRGSRVRVPFPAPGLFPEIVDEAGHFARLS